LQKRSNKGGDLSEIWYIDPANNAVVKSKTDFIAGYVLTVDGGEKVPFESMRLSTLSALTRRISIAVSAPCRPQRFPSTRIPLPLNGSATFRELRDAGWYPLQ
jgi:hypothetical protein